MNAKVCDCCLITRAHSDLWLLLMVGVLLRMSMGGMWFSMCSMFYNMDEGMNAQKRKARNIKVLEYCRLPCVAQATVCSSTVCRARRRFRCKTLCWLLFAVQDCSARSLTDCVDCSLPSELIIACAMCLRTHA